MATKVREYGFTTDGRKQAKVGCKSCFGSTIRPVGYERIVKDYVVVKTALYPTVPRSKDNWKLKHVWVWEQTHNRQLPKGWIVRFKDGNNRNFDPSNLCALSRGENGHINTLAKRLGVEAWSAETFDVLRTYAKLQSKTYERELVRPRRCIKCGALFVPDLLVSRREKKATNKQICRGCLGDTYKKLEKRKTK
jgi:predicted Zn-ribbon and HTH transcriptional regulator